MHPYPKIILLYNIGLQKGISKNDGNSQVKLVEQQAADFANDKDRGKYREVVNF